MIELLFHPFYDATLSMTGDGGLLIESSRRTMLAWGIVFCLLSAGALTAWLFRLARPAALAALVVALFIPALVMPSVRGEWIHVHPQRLTLHSGVWLWPTRREIDLAGLTGITQLDQEFRIGSKLVEPNAVWTLEFDDGARRTLVLNGFFTTHRLAVAQYLRDRGHVVCETGTDAVQPATWSC
jgi:hypothetical protein